MNAQSDLEHWQDYLEAALPSEANPTLVVRVFRETSSTQDVAKTFAPHRALVVADQQVAGRGRLGRSWLSTPGSSVLMSVCWPIDALATTHDRVSMAVGVALAKAVESIAPDAEVRLKWPNDILVDGRKLAGILIEGTRDTFIIGVGMNVTPEACNDPEIRPSTTSLAEMRRSIDRLTVIETIYIELHKALSSGNTNRLLEDWRARAALGETHTFEHHGRQIKGDIMDLDTDHGLIVRRDSGEIIVLPAATTSVVK
jgi:BirA family biotin operon repressor/biotin-[acetyl-CoA-carboxylase] ligase